MIKQIKIAFNLVKERYPDWGDYIILCECVKNKNYDNKTIRKAFKIFVLDCPYYTRPEKEEYVQYLKKITANKDKINKKTP